MICSKKRLIIIMNKWILKEKKEKYPFRTTRYAFNAITRNKQLFKLNWIVVATSIKRLCSIGTEVAKGASLGIFSLLLMPNLELKNYNVLQKHLENYMKHLCFIHVLFFSDLRGNRLQSITAEAFSSPFENLPKLRVL